ncbi:MAG: hypothetical protein ACXACP_00865 [Candidatus Hodarchaeales archaeon]|jgi:hypothetical protein
MESESPNITDVGIDITSPADLDFEKKYPDDLTNVTFLKKVRLWLFGKVCVGDFQADGWSRSLPIYAFTCSIHGVQLSYPSGWKRVLKCPLCF